MASLLETDVTMPGSNEPEIYRQARSDDDDEMVGLHLLASIAKSCALNSTYHHCCVHTAQ